MRSISAELDMVVAEIWIAAGFVIWDGWRPIVCFIIGIIMFAKGMRAYINSAREGSK